MVKKINKKHCSPDAYKQWEQCFLFIFFTTILLIIYIFSNSQGTTYIKN